MPFSRIPPWIISCHCQRPNKMPTRFLSTKFFIPRPRKVLVQRDQLFTLLNDGIPGKLILVSAPAGYGKTTLITAWLKNQKLPVPWLSLDEADNESQATGNFWFFN